MRIVPSRAENCWRTSRRRLTVCISSQSRKQANYVVGDGGGATAGAAAAISELVTFC